MSLQSFWVTCLRPVLLKVGLERTAGATQLTTDFKKQETAVHVLSTETESTFFFFFNLKLDRLFVLISHTFKNKSSFEKRKCLRLDYRAKHVIKRSSFCCEHSFVKIYFMPAGSQKYKLAKNLFAYHLEWEFFGMVEPLHISAPLKPGLSHIISHSLNRFSNCSFCTDLKKKMT